MVYTEEVKRILREFYLEYNEKLFSDKAKLKAYLSDYLGRYTYEYKLIKKAVDCEICDGLIAGKDSTSDISKYIKLLSERYGVPGQDSKDIVEILRFAITGVEKSDPKPIPDPKPAPAPKPIPAPKPAPAPKPIRDPKPAPAPKPIPDPKKRYSWFVLALVAIAIITIIIAIRLASGKPVDSGGGVDPTPSEPVIQTSTEPEIQTPSEPVIQTSTEPEIQTPTVQVTPTPVPPVTLVYSKNQQYKHDENQVKIYSVQVSATGDYEGAIMRRDKMLEAGYDAFIYEYEKEGLQPYRIMCGKFRDEKTALLYRESILANTDREDAYVTYFACVPEEVILAFENVFYQGSGIRDYTNLTEFG